VRITGGVGRVAVGKDELMGWYQTAAEVGHVDGIFSLGVLHVKGEGVSVSKGNEEGWHGARG
jgi:TPR repeat protein